MHLYSKESEQGSARGSLQQQLFAEESAVKKKKRELPGRTLVTA